jgi:ABC-type phosphate/phosphonate transport system substrate-binding protein
VVQQRICCFTARSDMDAALVQRITQAFVSIEAGDPAGKAVLEGERCHAFLPGTTSGWELLEKAAEQAGVF